ncbi:MAG: AsmA-like C-terminal region-containing protein, partial [Sediminibacterium sp.]
RIHALVSKEGKVNWDIFKPDTTTKPAAETKPLSLKLKQYKINDAYISYIDRESNMQAELLHLNHSGSGDFMNDIFTLSTTTSTDALSFSYHNIPYLVNTKTAVETAIQVDNKADKYTFKTGDISINNLNLFAEGFFQLLDSAYVMDIKFNAPSNDFKNILSLVPAVFKKDFDKVEANGKAVFNGFAKGTYSDSQIPAYGIHLEVQNGSFKYSDLPKPVKNINLKLDVTNPDGITDHTVVNIPQGHIEMDNEPFDFRLLLKNPVSSMFIDAAAKGKLNLAKVSQFAKLEEGSRLSGLLDADIKLKGSVTAIEKKQFDQFNASGTIRINQMDYASKAYPDGVNVAQLLMTFNPKNVTVNNFKGQYLKTNFNASGLLSNLLGYVLKNQPLEGSLNVKADAMNLNTWMAATSANSQTSTPATPFAVPANIKFNLDAAIGKVHYDKLDIEHLSGNMVLKDETIVMNNIRGEALGGTMLVNGSYSTKVSKKNPDVAFSYEVKEVDVQQTFNAFNTVQKLMPIGQFISGTFSSQLKLNGKLGENMMPQMNSLSGDGQMLLLKGVLANFEPVNKLASTLNVSQLKNISLSNVTNHFSFTNGKVNVKPFKIKVNDLNMEIAGAHGFDQSLDYNLNLQVPRSMMGSGANGLINNLSTKAGANGIPIKMSDVINLSVKMGGTIKNPNLKTDLKKGTSSLAEEAKAQATNAVKDTLKSVKTQAVTKAKEEVIKAVAKDTTTKKAIKNVLDGFFKKKN